MTTHAELKVLDAVVGLVTVLVMDGLMGIESTTEMLCEDMTMFEHVLPVDTNSDVSTRPLDATALPVPVLLTELVRDLTFAPDA